MKTINNDLRGLSVPETTHLKITPPNPFFSRMEHLLDNRGRIGDLMESIQAVGEEYSTDGLGINQYDMDGLMHDDRMEELYEMFCAQMDEFEAVELDVPEMPPPPHATVVMERVSDGAKVTELGCGNNVDLLRKIAQEKDYTGIDLSIEEDLLEPNFTLKAGDAIELIRSTEDAVGEVLISRNVLTQLEQKALEEVAQRDGVHVYPDIGELASCGIAQEQEDGTYTATSKDGEHFVDNLVDLPNLPIKSGYAAANTWKEEEIEVKFVAGAKVKGWVPQCQASEKFVTDDIGYKMDGVAMQLSITEGRACLKQRNGDAIVGVTNFGGSCKIDLELVSKNGYTTSAAVTRVRKWRDFVPFHSGNCLRYFAKRKKFKIYVPHEKPFEVFGPPDAFKDPPALGKNEFSYDGFIMRERERDYYTKFDWTVDISNPEGLKDYLEEMQIDVSFKEMKEGLWEYEVHEIQEGVYQFFPTRKRDDKLSADSFKTVLYKLAKLV